MEAMGLAQGMATEALPGVESLRQATKVQCIVYSMNMTTPGVIIQADAHLVENHPHIMVTVGDMCQGITRGGHQVETHHLLNMVPGINPLGVCVNLPVDLQVETLLQIMVILDMCERYYLIGDPIRNTCHTWRALTVIIIIPTGQIQLHLNLQGKILIIAVRKRNMVECCCQNGSLK